MITIDDIAKKRLAWAKHLQKENEKLKESECEAYTELSNLRGDNEKLEAEVKRLREILYNIREYAQNEMDFDDAFRVTDIINGDAQ